MRTFLATLAQHQTLIEQLKSDAEQITQAGQVIANCLAQNGKILFCGNGGSAADCQHIAAELVVRYEQHRKALAAIAMTTDTSILTAHSNDYDFSSVFSRQIEALGQTNDVLCAISTSGHSKNIISAATTAKAQGLTVVALTGGDGGELKHHADIAIIVPSSITARIQEAHILIGHWWCGYIEDLLTERSCFNPHSTSSVE
ncbi:D-sedoheptulose-7-phosphate isomerase [Methylocucumis oryzae]|uniref:Phosphoheptose isomerase n=1 Tax=Methylocucumis oryzae TaxID=1632867 RepID=A0A0F3ILJ3_9GAMM|nr:SIS domain-containing protein [Methylocucumis oryzae]KJV07537.1 phosphoheptose isomerase [Methylocucumis oryzae]